MKKRLAACVLLLAMLCTAMPAAATQGPEDVDKQQTAAASAERAAASSDPSEGTLMEKSAEYASRDMEEVELTLLPQEEHEALVDSSADDDSDWITMSCNYTAQNPISEIEYAEKQTKNFTCYGDQLPNLYYYLGNKQIAVGPVLKQLYSNLRADLAKGTNSAVFKGETSKVKKLGVSFYLPGLTETQYETMTKEMGWIAYMCLDMDSPEMFYSNGFCSMNWDIDYKTSIVTMYIIPGYRAGFTTTAQRVALKNKLDQKVNELVKQSQSYVTAYEKMMFFHDWLCENNTYNDEAAASPLGAYSGNISGTPWSSVGALLSSSDSSVKSPVCEGYSRAFQLLCQKVGIKATLVSSTSGNHMWNNVKYGTTWTGVDITWDDNGETSYTHDYFCRTVNGMAGHRMDDKNFADWLSYPVLTSIPSKGVLPYYDVSDNHWGRSVIQYVYDNQYMVGMSCVQFGTEMKVTRAQFVQMLYNLVEKPETAYTAQFVDVPDGKWYTDAVMWAYENQVVEGYGNGYFGVNDPITREQMVKMLCDYCGGLKEEDPNGEPNDDPNGEPNNEPNNDPNGDSNNEPNNDPNGDSNNEPNNEPNTNPNGEPDNDQNDESNGDSVDTPDTPDTPDAPSVLAGFADADAVSEWAYAPVCWAVENDLLHGYENSTLRPRGHATRTESAVLLKAMLEYLEKQEQKPEIEENQPAEDDTDTKPVDGTDEGVVGNEN